MASDNKDAKSRATGATGAIYTVCRFKRPLVLKKDDQREQVAERYEFALKSWSERSFVTVKPPAPIVCRIPRSMLTPPLAPAIPVAAPSADLALDDLLTLLSVTLPNSRKQPDDEPESSSAASGDDLACYPLLKQIYYHVAKKWCVSAFEAKQMPPDEAGAHQWRAVRILLHPSAAGSATGVVRPEDLYIVAADLCLLLHIRKGNVAKCVHPRNHPLDKAHRPVVRVPFNGVRKHAATVLSIYGMLDMLQRTRSVRKQSIKTWILKELAIITSTTPDDLDSTLSS